MYNLDRINHWRRVLATGLSFVVFGIGGVFFAITIVPVVWLCVRDRQAQARVTQYVIHYLFWFFIKFMIVVGVIEKPAVGGREKLLTDEPIIIIANHPTLIDVVLLLSILPQACCIVKEEVFRNPFLRPLAQFAGYIPNDDPERLIVDCVSVLQAGNSLVIFPEGSRSPKNALRPFHRGAAHIALRVGCKVQPVFIWSDPPTLLKGAPWYEIPSTKAKMSVRALEAISPLRITDERMMLLAARKLTEQWERLYGALVENSCVEEQAIDEATLSVCPERSR